MESLNVCIGYLTDIRRTYTFETFVMFLNKMKNKNKLHLLVLITQGVPPGFFEDIIKTKSKDIAYTIVEFTNNNNYIHKIKTLINFSKDHNIKYCMKFDNDIIINNHILDYMIDNVNLLENPDNLYITPALSSGIPTTDMFINDFFDEKEKEHIHNLFLKTTMPNELWGFNYSELNRHTIYANNWNIENFTTNLNDMECFYKGIHPIRIDRNSINYMNEFLMKNKHKIFDIQAYKTQIVNNPNYLCNSIFIIGADNYSNLVEHSSLYVDPYDEVPVNKYCKINKLNGIIIRNSFSVHPIYNTIPGFPAIEKKFYLEFMA